MTQTHFGEMKICEVMATGVLFRVAEHQYYAKKWYGAPEYVFFI